MVKHPSIGITDGALDQYIELRYVSDQLNQYFKMASRS